MSENEGFGQIDQDGSQYQPGADQDDGPGRKPDGTGEGTQGRPEPTFPDDREWKDDLDGDGFADGDTDEGQGPPPDGLDTTEGTGADSPQTDPPPRGGGSSTHGGGGTYGGTMGTTPPGGYDGQEGAFGYTLPAWVYYQMESYGHGNAVAGAGQYAAMRQGRSSLTHEGHFQSGSALTTFRTHDMTTEHNCWSYAAINPDLQHTLWTDYQKRHQNGKLASDTEHGHLTMTFKTLKAWELWARTDPMCIGNMNYVALVYPGCGTKVGDKCTGGGDVNLSLCAWMKPGPKQDKSEWEDEDVPEYIGNPPYSSIPGDSHIKVPTKKCQNKDHITSMKAKPGKYERKFGKQGTSPFIAGIQFKHRFDIKDMLEELGKISCWLVAYYQGWLFGGIGAIEMFVDGFYPQTKSINPFWNYVPEKNQTGATIEPKIKEYIKQTLGWDAYRLGAIYVQLTGNNKNGFRAIGQNGGLKLEKYMDMNNRSLWHENTNATFPRVGLAMAKIKKRDCVPYGTTWNHGAPLTETLYFNSTNLINKAIDFVGKLSKDMEKGNGKTAAMKWEQAVRRYLKKQLKQQQADHNGMRAKARDKRNEWNATITKLAEKIGSDPKPGIFHGPEQDDVGEGLRGVDFKRLIINVLEFDGALPKVGYVTSDIPGTVVMGIKIFPIDAEADAVQISNPDGICAGRQGSGADGFPRTSPITTEYMTSHSNASGRGHSGSSGPSFLSQDGGGYPICERYGQGVKCINVGYQTSGSGNPTASGSWAVYPSYAPATPYDPLQEPVEERFASGFGQSLVWGSGEFDYLPPHSGGLSPGDATLRRPHPHYHGNNLNGNDVRIVENCQLSPCRGAAVNSCVRQRAPGASLSGNIPIGRSVDYTQRTMTVLMRNNVIIHQFAPPAYPVESGIFPPGGKNTLTENEAGVGPDRIKTDVSMEFLVGQTLAGTYEQSTRTLTASGAWGLNFPSWVKRNSKVIFHHNHACSGVEYKIDKRIGASGILLAAASNPGSNVGPGAIFELRPKLYAGPIQKNHYAKRIGYAPSVISVKNQAWNGGQLEVWMQNNTIMGHPDACLPEDNTPLGALRRGHNIDSAGMHDGRGSMATSGYLKSFAPKYISVANMTFSRPLITNPSGTYDNPPPSFLGPPGANTGWTQSHLNINMENNLICPVYNARLPVGKDYVDEETSSSPKWDVVADVGLPVVNANSSGCVISHCSITNNVIVGRMVFDTTQKKYVQHSKDGNNILVNLPQGNNSQHPDLIPSGNLGYRWPFASGFYVYPGGPDDVFRSFYGPFYEDNLSDKNVPVTGKGDSLDSFTKQKSGFLQYTLNDGVLYKKGAMPLILKETFMKIPGYVLGLPTHRDMASDFMGKYVFYNHSDAESLNLSKKLPPGVLEDKRAPKNSSEEDLVLSFGEKAILEHPPKSAVSGESPRELRSTRHTYRSASTVQPKDGGYYIGACCSLPLRYDAKTKTHQADKNKRRTSIRRSSEKNPGVFGTVGQKQDNISSSGTYVNIDNSIPLHFFAEIPETITGGKTSDVIDYPNKNMPATKGGGLRVSSGGKNDRPIVGQDDLGNVEIHLGQSRGHVEDNEKAAENIDRLFDRFKTEGDSTQYGE